MVGNPTTHEAATPPDEIIDIKTEVGVRLSSATDFDPECLETVQRLPDKYWQDLIATINDPESLDNITDDNWAESFSRSSTEAALSRLASIKAILPEDNARKQRNQHNITLENYIKLALDAAEDVSYLRVFGEVIRAKLMGGDENPVLAMQVLHIWAPAAEIAGLHELQTELEEVAFDVLYPGEKRAVVEEYAHLGGDTALEAKIAERKADLYLLLGDELDADDATLTISGRRKSYFSIWRKAMKKGQRHFSLTDFLGMRIIVESEEGEDKAIEHCYSIADIVTQLFKPEPGRYKDYVMNPKANGYQSLHMTVRDDDEAQLEFQVRTGAMHHDAEFDPNISHKAYSASTKLTPGKYFGKNLARPERIYGWRERVSAEIRSRRNAGDNSLVNLEPGKLLAFAADGNLHKFDDGETLLDFAFAVHKRRALTLQYIFNRGTAARFEEPIKFGDVVKLSYHPDKEHLTWSGSWFDKVKASSSRNTLRTADHKRHAAKYASIAPDLIIQEITKQYRRRLGRKVLQGLVTMIRTLDEEQREAIGARYGLSYEQALVNIGSGAFKPGKAATYLATMAGAVVISKPPKEVVERKAQHHYRDDEGQKWEIEVQGTLGCDHHIAGCCSIEPIKPGESIVSVPCRTTGDLSVHRVACVNLPDESDKILESGWQPLRQPMAAAA